MQADLWTSGVYNCKI